MVFRFAGPELSARSASALAPSSSGLALTSRCARGEVHPRADAEPGYLTRRPTRVDLAPRAPLRSLSCCTTTRLPKYGRPPEPPYPKAPPCKGVTTTRPLFLLAAGFTLAQIQARAGSSRKQITTLQHEIKFWRGDHQFLLPGVPDRRVLFGVCDHFRVPHEPRGLKAAAPRRTLRDAMAAEQVPWESIDRLPGPEVLAVPIAVTRARPPTVR